MGPILDVHVSYLCRATVIFSVLVNPEQGQSKLERQPPSEEIQSLKGWEAEQCLQVYHHVYVYGTEKAAAASASQKQLLLATTRVSSEAARRPQHAPPLDLQMCTVWLKLLESLSRQLRYDIQLFVFLCYR